MTATERRHSGPPHEAYSRVTDAERFRPLHTVATELLARLATEYVVDERDTFTVLAGMPAIEHARPPVTLVPMAPATAQIAIAFTTLPGLIVRCGRWLVEPFPACGCDACAETADAEIDRLRTLIDDVVAGRFREELSTQVLTRPRVRWALGGESPAGPRREGMRVVTRTEARQLGSNGRGRVKWQTWPRRRGRSAGSPA